MILRSLLICSVGIGATSLMIGTFATAIAQRDVARGELGSCAAYSGLPSDDSDTAGMVFIRGGTFVMGSERHRPEERFTHTVRVDGFWIDRHEVTNAQFREFVAATGYRHAQGAARPRLGRIRPAHQCRGWRPDHPVVPIRGGRQLARPDWARQFD
jgi:formylglycine-generating enzyme required for sulfatase activity